MRDPVPTANQPNVSGAAMLNQMSPFVLAVMVKVKLKLLSTWAKVTDGEVSLVGVSAAASAVSASTTHRRAKCRGNAYLTKALRRERGSSTGVSLQSIVNGDTQVLASRVKGKRKRRKEGRKQRKGGFVLKRKLRRCFWPLLHTPRQWQCAAQCAVSAGARSWAAGLVKAGKPP